MPKEKKRGQKRWDHESLEVAFYAHDRDYDATSKATGCPKNTLYQIGKRKEWKTLGNGQRKLQQAREEIRAIDPDIVTSVREVVRNAFETQREGFRSSMSQALHRTGEYIGTMPGDAILSESRRVKDILDSGAKLYGFGEDGHKAQISVNVLGLSLDGFAAMPAVSL